MIKLVQGFDIGSPLPIDGRILLSYQEMYNIDDNILPEKYFAFSKEDGKLYLYDKNNVVTPQLGKFRLAEDGTDARIDEEIARAKAKENQLQDQLDIHEARVDNPHSVTKAQVGLGNVDNTSDANKPISIAAENRFLAENAELKEYTDTEVQNLRVVTGRYLHIDKQHLDDEFRFKVQLMNSDNEIISESEEIDLPLESVVVSGSYDEETKEVVLTLQDGSEIRFSVADLIDGLVNEDTFNAHVNNEDVNHQHINESERAKIAASMTPSQLKTYLLAGANVQKKTSGSYVTLGTTSYIAGAGVTISPSTELANTNVISAESAAPYWDLIQSEYELDSEGNPVFDSEGFPIVIGRGPLSNKQLAQVLNTKLDEEEYRAEQDEFRSEIEDILDSEGNKIDEIFNVLDSMGEEIAQDIDELRSADSALSSRISAVDAKSDTNALNINQEASARQSKDAELSAAISDEVTARTNADTALQGNIDAENARAELAETDLNSAIETEVARASGVESGLDTAINDEITRATGVEGGLDTRLTEVESDIDKKVVKNLESFTQYPDRIVVTHTDINIATGAESYEVKDLPLANNENAGLMSPTDITAIAELQHKVSALEGKSTRLWYQTEEDLMTDSEGNQIFLVEYIDEEHGDYWVTYKVTGTTQSDLRITAGSNSKQAGYVFTPSGLDTEGRIIVSIFEIRDGYDNVNYHFNMTTGHIHRDADAEDINAFAEDHGFEAPFTGLAIVIEHTYHIWRYYPNMENGQVIGWRDDGADTVSQFTNTNAGIIKGAGAVDGKVYAESDGTGSVYGWSTLTGNVTNLMNNSATKTELTNGLAGKVDKVTGKSLINDSDITKLSGIATGATKVEASATNGKIKINGTDTTVYTHPNNKSAQSGFKKLTSDTEGHVTGGTAVAASDITGLEPYNAGNGLASTTNDGKVTFKSTYASESVITGLVADSGSWNAVTDSEGNVLYYYADVNVTGVTENSNPVLDIVISGSDYANVDALNEAWSKIYSGESGNGYIRLYANEMPEISFNISIKGY